MLIVQRITTEWTKKSRGGVRAADRNTTPDAIQLPPTAGPAPSCLVHSIRFLEWENFACYSDVIESEIEEHFRVEPLFLRVRKDYVETRFVWSWNHCGAPKRESHDLFRLALGQWGRFVCNGRFGAESMSGREWGYHKSVFNVAFVYAYDNDLFLRTMPNAESSRLAVLK